MDKNFIIHKFQWSWLSLSFTIYIVNKILELDTWLQQRGILFGVYWTVARKGAELTGSGFSYAFPHTWSWM